MSDRKGGVWVNPAVVGGKPCLGGTRIPVEMVIGIVWTADVKTAMGLWRLTRGQVLDACWYAGSGYLVRTGRRGPWRKRWGTWAEEAHGHLWGSAYDRVTDPPTEAGERQ